MTRNRFIVTICQGFLLLPILQSAAQPVLQTLLTNGPTASRINLVFLSEGYTAGQFTQFTNNSAAILARVLATPPFADYRTYFNAYALFVSSAQSGSDHPTNNIYRDTYFNSTYDSYGISYLITIPPNDHDANYSHGRGKVDALLETNFPEYDLAFLVVNDTAYGGSGGMPIIASVHQSSTEIGVHELAHNYANLGDEYTTPYPGYPDTEEPNTTRETSRDLIKWHSCTSATISSSQIRPLSPANFIGFVIHER